MVSEFLRKKGFNVVPAFDSMQAMMGVRNASPKAVILDVNMPGGGGIDVIKKLKSMTKTTQIPVLIMTASLDPKVADEVRDLGADEFLTKPVDLEKLHAALLRVLGRPAEATGASRPSYI
jgi:DNA-binding response OmpR family regulator